MKPLNILFIAAEASPFAKVGGLGDVIGSLPKALRKVGHDARIILPKYRTINNNYSVISRDSFSLNFMGRQEPVEIVETRLIDGTPVYLVGNARYFDRASIYGEYDDAERFLCFCKAAFEIPRRLNWKPDVIHSHDWHTAICASILKADYKNDPLYAGTGSVFTIHNLAYQGSFHESFVGMAGLENYLIPPDSPFRFQTFNMMSIGIFHTDVVTTVSETYASEILTTEFGCGLENLLLSRKADLLGILNGIDYEEFNPATDPQIVAGYDAEHPEGKIKNKLALQKQVGLPENEHIPLIGMAGRLVDQKGPEITAEAMEKLLPDTEFQFILQGLGELKYLELFERLARFYPEKIRLCFVLDFTLIQRIYAGSDIFLMPSRFEPCGLVPMIAMRYGAVPVVRHTGGMVETTPDLSPDLSTGRGFNFEGYDADDLSSVVRRALAGYAVKEKWRQLVIRDMKADFTWNAAIPRYEAVYKLALRKARPL